LVLPPASRSEKAVKVLLNALSLDPEMVAAQFDLGLALLVGDPEVARRS
jgi:hypothetical protein